MTASSGNVSVTSDRKSKVATSEKPVASRLTIRSEPPVRCAIRGNDAAGSTDSEEPIATGYEHLPDNVSPEDIHGDEPDFEKREFHAQIEGYREQHGRFPWEP